jgi:hypothetical protein
MPDDLAPTVATEVMGWRHQDPIGADAIRLREFHWADAEGRAQGWQMTLSCNQFIGEPWDCRLFLEGVRGRRAIAHGATAAEAICKCALDAVRGER